MACIIINGAGQSNGKMKIGIVMGKATDEAGKIQDWRSKLV